MKFIPNEAGIAEFERSAQMNLAMLEVATPLAAEIRALTPASVSDPTTGSNAAPPGTMRDSIVPLVADGIVVIAATDGRFHWIEFGTGYRRTSAGAFRGRMPAYHPFVRVCEATGHYVPAGRISRLKSGPRRGALNIAKSRASRSYRTVHWARRK